MYMVYLLNKNKLGNLINTNSVEIEALETLNDKESEGLKTLIFKDNMYNVLFIPKKIYKTFNNDVKKHIDNNTISDDIDINEIMHKNLLYIIVDDDKNMFELYSYIKHYDNIHHEEHMVGIIMENKGYNNGS